MQFKTLLNNQYGGDVEPYTKNYSNRNLNQSRDPRVILNHADELKGDSHLQVAPHSRRFVKPESLLSKTPAQQHSKYDKLVSLNSGAAP